jgi:hypothetical protein
LIGCLIATARRGYRAAVPVFSVGFLLLIGQLITIARRSYRAAAPVRRYRYNYFEDRSRLRYLLEFSLPRRIIRLLPLSSRLRYHRRYPRNIGTPQDLSPVSE